MRQAVQIGGIHIFIACISRSLRPPLVYQNIEDVGLFGGVLGRERLTEKKKG
jgi:hypothetical protein